MQIAMGGVIGSITDMVGYSELIFYKENNMNIEQVVKKIKKEFKHHDSVLVVSNSVYCNEIFTKLEIKDNKKVWYFRTNIDSEQHSIRGKLFTSVIYVSSGYFNRSVDPYLLKNKENKKALDESIELNTMRSNYFSIKYIAI